MAGDTKSGCGVEKKDFVDRWAGRDERKNGERCATFALWLLDQNERALQHPSIPRPRKQTMRQVSTDCLCGNAIHL